MTNSIPLTFRAAPFPEGYKADPEQFKNDLVARLYAESTEAISFFASGSVAPSSNVGPWLKNGETWYVWDNGTAAYVPQIIDQASLGYIAQLAAPDQNVYTLWVQLDGAGKAQAIKYYSGAAWKDVYEDKFATYSTTTQMNTAISNAIAAIPPATPFASYPAQAELTAGPQAVVMGAAPVKCTLNLAPTNPAPAPFDTTLYRYIAPAAGVYTAGALAVITVGGATSAGMEITLRLYVNGSDTGVFAFNGTPSPNNDAWTVAIPPIILTLAITDYVEFYIEATDGVNVGSCNLTNIDASFVRVSE